MEDFNYQHSYQEITTEIELWYLIPLIIGLALPWLLYLTNNPNNAQRLIKISLSILYLYSGLVYCSWEPACVLFLYSILLIVNLNFISVWNILSGTDYITYSRSSLALCFPVSIVFSMLIPESNYFACPYLLFAYSYCLVARFNLKKKSYRSAIKIHVSFI